MNRHIAIIGGGIAGLSAAAELVRNDCSVTVLEARDRLGGRVHTIHDRSLPIELGAEFLHGENESVANVIKAAGLLHLQHKVRRVYRRLFDGTEFTSAKTGAPVPREACIPQR